MIHVFGQARVVRFYVSWPPLSVFSSSSSAEPQLQARDRGSKPRIRVVPAGPQLQALDRSGPPPDPNSNRWMKVSPAGPRPQRISEDISDRMPERMSEDMPATCAR